MSCVFLNQTQDTINFKSIIKKEMSQPPSFFESLCTGDVKQIVLQTGQGDRNVLGSEVHQISSTEGLIRSGGARSCIQKRRWRQLSDNAYRERVARNERERARRATEGDEERSVRLAVQAESRRQSRLRRQSLLQAGGNGVSSLVDLSPNHRVYKIKHNVTITERHEFQHSVHMCTTDTAFGTVFNIERSGEKIESITPDIEPISGSESNE